MKKYALVGTGGRATTFLEGIVVSHRDAAQLCALCDVSPTRMQFYNDRIGGDWGGKPVPVYAAEDFDRMLAEQRPDAVVVTSVDSTHGDYIVRALAAGCDAITEKPMTTEAETCRAILEAAESSEGEVRVCFNYRWQASSTRIRELIAAGEIGEVKSVHLDYALDTRHGADYFRRWHSDKSQSGGLQIHKSTHHFDLVNWWIDAIPEEVFAYGGLVFYGKENALARGDEKLTRYDRYTGTESAGDPFALDLAANENLRQLYLHAEKETGYLRDRNVFREGIGIEDTLAMLVKYRTGVVLTYSLNAFSPVEGYRVVFHGSRGRLEYQHWGGSHIIAGQTDAELAAEQESGGKFEELLVRPHFKPARAVEIPAQHGGHGGADPLLAEQIFATNPPEEKLGRNAGAEQGAASVIVGIAANESLRTGSPVRAADLITLRPDAKRLSELTR